MLVIKEWFLNKEFDSEEKYILSVSDRFSVEAETDKAICIKWFSKVGNVKKWLPKSVIE